MEMSGERRDDQVTVCIDQMLKDLSYTPSNPSIYRISDRLRSTNEKAYDPRIIAIGPYHHDKEHLNNMEHQKKIYLKLLLASRGECVDRYVKVIRDLEDRAHKCYAEPMTLGKDEFVQMLLLDGIFIIEFLREYDKVDKGGVVDKDNAIFQLGHVISHLLHDLVLFENQIPLFILEELFKLSKIHDQEEISDLIWPLVLPSPMPEGKSFQVSNAHHLLGLVHYVRCWSFAPILSSEVDSAHVMENIYSATELKEAGIIFKKSKDEGSSWLDIKFKRRKIYIPMLIISDVTESWFRNMIAYEYYLPRSDPKYITDYTFFLHCLIHTPKDAQLLRRCGIISNWLGGDEMVYHLINQLGTNVQPSEKFSYFDVFCNLNHHCEHRRNRWMAILKRDYFNSPWKLISLVAGIILLAVGVVQMVFAILSYSKLTNIHFHLSIRTADFTLEKTCLVREFHFLGT
ncbi:hypothetical protein Pfo_016274 [Paulownia fortunei]|nr:hypothetical protein Pfo_016274 [Paulownia fortunei]